MTALVGTASLTAVVAVGWIGWLWHESRLPGTYGVMELGTPDHGGGDALASVHHVSTRGTSVESLHGPRSGTPDAAFVLTARHATVTLASGREIEALTFDGRSPGPELRVRQGDLVEVVLTNEDVTQGVTIHWHGVDVPNAEDGVAGVTQDAVLPGERHVYRFRAEQVGTFWYHTHQISSKEVRRGLFGTFVIEPRGASRHDVDETIVAHSYNGVPTLNGSDLLAQRDVAPGTTIRWRLVNTDSTAHRFSLSGSPFRVVALDGTKVRGPTLLRDVAVEVAGGGRVDIAFSMPDQPVWLTLDDAQVGIALNATGQAPPLAGPVEAFDPLRYGHGERTGYSPVDRRFELRIGRKPGFFDGRPGLQWTINDGIFPDVPTFVVEEGDVVEMTIENDTDADHPMHLHGHHVLVVERNGEAASGSSWITDTLNVAPRERYRVVFRADNPGIWMDHCHNLRHARDGLTMHVAYAGVTTPFLIGSDHRNQPE